MRRYLSVLIILFCFTTVGYSKSKLLVFVGKKIEVSTDTSGNFSLSKDRIGPPLYLAVYQVLQLVRGNFEMDTVSFYISGGFSPPEDTNYENALFFLCQTFDGYYCLDCVDVYKTEDSQWAGRYASEKYGVKIGFNEAVSVQPQRISFEKELSFDLSACSDEYIEDHYPSAYYCVEKNRAVALYGNYLDDLLKLKKRKMDLKVRFAEFDPELHILVGKKIKVSKIPESDRFTAVFQVLKQLKEHLKEDTVSFFTPDDFSTPPEIAYENVLLYLYKTNDGYHCLEYMDVYKTADNNWASHYACEDYNCNLNKSIDVKPEKISFEKTLSIDLDAYRSKHKYIKNIEKHIEKHFPSPYYEIREDKAIALYGYYLDDILKLKERSFNARGYYY
jgi:hypothetical protein